MSTGIMSDHIGSIGYVTEYGSTITAKKTTKTGHRNVNMFDTSEYWLIDWARFNVPPNTL